MKPERRCESEAFCQNNSFLMTAQTLLSVSFFKKERQHFWFFSKQENIPWLMMAAVPFDVIWDAEEKTEWFPRRWTIIHYL